MADESIIPAESPEVVKTPCGCKGMVLGTAVAGTASVPLPPCPNDGVAYVLQCFNGNIAWVRV